jgi:hypothetical protein
MEGVWRQLEAAGLARDLFDEFAGVVTQAILEIQPSHQSPSASEFVRRAAEPLSKHAGSMLAILDAVCRSAPADGFDGLRYVRPLTPDEKILSELVGGIVAFDRLRRQLRSLQHLPGTMGPSYRAPRRALEKPQGHVCRAVSRFLIEELDQPLDAVVATIANVIFQDLGADSGGVDPENVKKFRKVVQGKNSRKK